MEPAFKKQRQMLVDRCGREGTSTAALWVLIRAIDAQEPELVKMIEAVIEAQSWVTYQIYLDLAVCDGTDSMVCVCLLYTSPSPRDS